MVNRECNSGTVILATLPHWYHQYVYIVRDSRGLPVLQILLQFPIDLAATISKLRKLDAAFHGDEDRHIIPASYITRSRLHSKIHGGFSGGAKRQQNFRGIWRTIDGAST